MDVVARGEGRRMVGGGGEHKMVENQKDVKGSGLESKETRANSSSNATRVHRSGYSVASPRTAVRIGAAQAQLACSGVVCVVCCLCVGEGRGGGGEERGGGGGQRQ